MVAAEIATLVKQAAARFGGRTMVTFVGAGSFTFREMEDFVSHFTGGLKNLGIAEGDRVTLYLPNSWEWLVAYHAIARIGAVVVPANILLSAGEVSYILDNSDSIALICQAEKLAGIERSDSVRTITVGGSVSRSIEFSMLLDGPPTEPAQVSPDNLFTIGYTSGTTGKPKGAMLTHRNVYESLATTATIHVRHSGDTVLSALPFPHVYGNIVMNSAFLCGMRLVALPRFDAGEVLRLISEEKVTLFEGVPTMFYQMLAHPDITKANLTSLTRCTVGGQTMPTAKIEAVVERFGCPLLELWGMTEVAGPAISHSPYWVPRHGSIGLPFPGFSVRIARLDDPSRDAEPGHAGELMVKGPLVTKGYWKNEVATAETIDTAGWLGTGDIATADAEGFVYIVDRKKDMIITAGYNVYPAEIEQVIAMHPAVAMVAVASIPDEEKGEIARAVVVRHRNASLDEAELLTHCRKHLASYKVPRLVTFANDLPKTSTGKILRRELNTIGL